jgi:predicted small lipoprotein YifL
MSKRYLIVLSILLLAASLGACGQKGPLYLPSGTDQAASR